jgi:predicted nucleic acid-binding protein
MSTLESNAQATTAVAATANLTLRGIDLLVLGLGARREVSIRRRAGTQYTNHLGDCFRLLDSIVRQVFSIERADVEQAAEIAGLQRRLSARDALHLAVMRRHGVERVLTLDEGFDLWPGIERAPLRER